MRRKTFVAVVVLLAAIAAVVPVFAQTPTEAWTRIAVSYSGNITALAVSPSYETDKTLYIGVSGGGLWKSNTRGETWLQCAAVPCDATVTGICLPGNYQHSMTLPAYAVTQEGSFYRSTDDFTSYTDTYAFTAACTSIVASRSPYVVYVGTSGAGVWMHQGGGVGTGWGFIGVDGVGEVCLSLTITGAATQKVWGAFFDAASGSRVWEYTGTGQQWTDRTPSALTAQDVLFIRASFVNTGYVWIGTKNKGMWRTITGGGSWAAACDGVSGTSTTAFSVRAIRECPASATDHEVWEGRSDGMMTSSDYGVTCSESFPTSQINCIDFTPGFDMGSGFTYCEAFVGTATALYRIPCAGSSVMKSPMVVDGKTVAASKDGKQYFMGSMTGGLYKCIYDPDFPSRYNMVQYNNFPNGQTPQIVAICLHPSYNENDPCGDATTLFAAANFPDAPVDNGVYYSQDAANSWVKLSSGWPTAGAVFVRDLAISPNYTSDGTLFAATSLYLYRWTGTGWVKCGEGTTPNDIYWVALTPTFNAASSCTNSGQSGYPCKMVWIGAMNGNPQTRLYYNFLAGSGGFTEVYPTAVCPSGATCPIDVTGIVFPKDFGLDDGSSYHKIFVSSSSKGILRSMVYLWSGTSWSTFNSGIPASLNVVDIAADPDWAQGCPNADAIMLCAVGANPSPGDPGLAGIYRGTTANGTPSWTQIIPGRGLSVCYETRWSGSGDTHVVAMAGLKRDAAVDPDSLYGAFCSGDSGQNFNNFSGYYSLPDDVFSSVAHESNSDYIFASSPSMGVFVSKDKGESFHPYNKGGGMTAGGPCYLKNGYGITMQANRRGAGLDAIWVGTLEGIKARYIWTDSLGAVDLYHENGTTTPPESLWKHSYLSGGSTPTSGYFERIEVVPNSSQYYPIWAVSPEKTGYTAQGFAALLAGTYDGWIFQNSGIPSGLNAKSARLGFGSGTGGALELTSGMPISESVTYDEWDYYSISVGTSATDLQVLLEDPDGGSGSAQQADLYVKYGSFPSTSDFDYNDYVWGSQDVCVTSILFENFNGTWGTYGGNPPAGWTITSNEAIPPATWGTDNWYKSSNAAAVVSSASRTTQTEIIVSPAFTIPSTLTSAVLYYYHQMILDVNDAADGYVEFKSDQVTSWTQLMHYYKDMPAGANTSVSLTSYIGNTNCQIRFRYVDSNPSTTTGRGWRFDNFRVSGSSPQRLRAGTWYIGVHGYNNTANNYKLTATLNVGCVQTFSMGGEDRKKAATGGNTALPDPKAPAAGTTWGTVNGSGVYRGTGTISLTESGPDPSAIAWIQRNGVSPTDLTNLNAKTVIQLPDLTLIAGCDASSLSDRGIWYSPAGNEGQTIWYQATAVANQGSKNYVDLIQAGNGDVLMAGSGTGTTTETKGGVWLSGDKGRNWMRISQGFDANSQELADIVADSGSPPSYYASTDETGLWTRTVSASPYPTVSGISPTSGPSTGGTSVNISGTGFSNSCPTGVSGDCPDSTPMVIFGDTEVSGTYVSATQITCTTPPHLSGLVAVKVRNRDTRQSATYANFTFNLVCENPSAFTNNTATDVSGCADSGVKIDWSAPEDWGDEGGIRTFDVLRNGSAIASTLGSTTLTYTDTTGTNGTAYTYSVRANNGCGSSTTTSGASAADYITPSTPTASNNGPICAGSTLMLSTPAVSGATYSWTGPNGFTSAVQNPSITNATTAATGTYSVTITVNGCTSAAGTTSATVKAKPATPTAGNNGPICAGSTLSLTASTISGATYSWTGPNGFTSAVQNPSITNATTAATGTYSVTATVSGCTSTAGTTNATVNDAPGQAEITDITDVDSCVQSGIHVLYTAGAGATSHDLYRDGSLVVTGYASGAVYDPQDTVSHNYRIRAVIGSCYSISELMSGTDTDNGVGVPAVPGVADINGCATDGVTVTWAPVTGATGYDLRVDGTTTYSDVSSPYTFTPGDNSSHNYKVRAKNALCTSDWSPVTSGTDLNGSPSSPSIISIVDNDPGVLDGVVITFTPGSPSTAHYLYADLSLVSTNFTSGSIYLPGDSEIHGYMIKTVNGDCSEDSSSVNGRDLAIAIPPEIAPGDTVGTAQTWSADKTTQSWPVAAEADGYYLYRIRKPDLGNLQDATEEGCIRDLGAASSLDCSSDDPSGLPNRIYYYLVTGYNAAGEGPAGEGTGFTRDLSSTNPCN